MNKKTSKLEWAFYTLAFFFLIYLFGKDRLDKYRLKNQGQVTVGIYTGSYVGNRRGTYYSSYTFQVDHDVVKGSYPDSKTHATLNDSLTIIYLPSDPNINAPACDILGIDKVKYP